MSLQLFITVYLIHAQYVYKNILPFQLQDSFSRHSLSVFYFYVLLKIAHI